MGLAEKKSRKKTGTPNGRVARRPAAAASLQVQHTHRHTDAPCPKSASLGLQEDPQANEEANERASQSRANTTQMPACLARVKIERVQYPFTVRCVQLKCAVRRSLMLNSKKKKHPLLVLSSSLHLCFLHILCIEPCPPRPPLLSLPPSRPHLCLSTHPLPAMTRSRSGSWRSAASSSTMTTSTFVMEARRSVSISQLIPA